MEFDHQGSILPNIKNYKKSIEIFEKFSEDQNRKNERISKNINNYNLNIKIGPNVNIKLSKNTAYTTEQKDWFDKKLKQTKKQKCAKIGFYTETVFTKINAPLPMVKMNSEPKKYVTVTTNIKPKFAKHLLRKCIVPLVIDANTGISSQKKEF